MMAEVDDTPTLNNVARVFRILDEIEELLAEVRELAQSMKEQDDD
jgi:HAMP domain-containing protein